MRTPSGRAWPSDRVVLHDDDALVPRRVIAAGVRRRRDDGVGRARHLDDGGRRGHRQRDAVLQLQVPTRFESPRMHAVRGTAWQHGRLLPMSPRPGRRVGAPGVPDLIAHLVSPALYSGLVAPGTP